MHQCSSDRGLSAICQEVFGSWPQFEPERFFLERICQFYSTRGRTRDGEGHVSVLGNENIFLGLPLRALVSFSVTAQEKSGLCVHIPYIWSIFRNLGFTQRTEVA